MAHWENVTPPRDLSSSNTFHVLNRGADRQDIFWKDRDRRAFLDILGERAERHSVSIMAFALMSNHFHVVLEIEDGDLPAMMSEFQATYSRRLNRRTDRSGPLVEGRYTSVPIVDDEQFVQTVRYVHRNPIAITGTDQLVQWKWSSLRPALSGRGEPAWLQLDLLGRRMDLTGHLDHVLAPQPGDRFPYRWLPPMRPTTFSQLQDAVSVGCNGCPTRDATLALILLSDLLRAATPDEVAAHLRLRVKTVRNLRAESKARIVDRAHFRAMVDRTIDILG